MRHLPAFVAAAIAASSLSFVLPVSAGTTKAWTAAKANVPADTSVVIGVDVAGVAGSATFQKLFPQVLAKNADMQQGLDLVKTACKIDPMTAIKGLAVALDATQSDGVVFVQVPELNPTKLVACMKEIAKAKGKTDKIDGLVVKTDGAITEMTASGQSMYVGWVSGDVLVMVPKHLDDKAALKAWMAGGFAKGALSKLMGKVKTDSTMFVGSTANKTIDSTHTLKQGYGWVALAAGKLGIEFHADLGDPAAAASLAKDAATQLDQVRQNPPLPSLADLLKTVTVAPAGPEIVVKASVVEKDLGDMLAMVLASL